MHRQVGLAVFPQEARSPIERMIERAPFAGRGALFHPDIGPDRVARIGQQAFQLSLDHRRIGFQFIEPGEVLAIEILVGGKEGVIQPRAFVVIGGAAAQRPIDEGRDPALLRLAPLALSRRQHGIGAGGHARPQRVAIGQARRQFLFDLGGKPRLAIHQLAHVVPRHQRGLLFAAALEQLCQPQLRSEVEPIDRQRPVKRGAFARIVARQTVGVGQVAPQGQGPGIGRSRAGKGPNRGRPVAGTDRGHAFSVGFKRFARWLGRGLGHCAARDRPASASPQGVLPLGRGTSNLPAWLKLPLPC